MKTKKKTTPAKPQINDPILRKILLKAQSGCVSTSDIVEIFMNPELYNKLYHGLGCGKKLPKQIKLTGDEINSVSYAITAMANTFLDVSRHVSKLRRRKGE